MRHKEAKEKNGNSRKWFRGKKDTAERRTLGILGKEEKACGQEKRFGEKC